MRNSRLAVVVGRDVAPSGAFALLKLALEAADWQVVSALGKGKALESAVFNTAYDAVSSADVVVLGMSAPSINAAEELVIANHAIESGKRVIFYADTFRAWSRTWFRDVIGRATQVWLATADQTEYYDASRYFFPVVPPRNFTEDVAHDVAGMKAASLLRCTGNPLWEEFGVPPELDSAEVRRGCNIPLDNVWVVASPGGKDEILNVTAWRALRRAVDEIRGLHVVLTRHPGDKTEQVVYDRQLDCNDRFKFAPSAITSSLLVSAADVLVEPNPTALAMQAAMTARIPALTVMSERGNARLLEVSGTNVWPLWALGVGAPTSEVDLARDLGEMLTGQGRRAMITRQHQVFPSIPPRGTAIATMVEELNALVRG